MQPGPSIPSDRTKVQCHSQVGSNDHPQKVSTAASEANAKDQCQLCKVWCSFLNKTGQCHSTVRVEIMGYEYRRLSTLAQPEFRDSTTQRKLRF
jgi:hypothetical protein